MAVPHARALHTIDRHAETPVQIQQPTEQSAMERIHHAVHWPQNHQGNSTRLVEENRLEGRQQLRCALTQRARVSHVRLHLATVHEVWRTAGRDHKALPPLAERERHLDGRRLEEGGEHRMDATANNRDRNIYINQLKYNEKKIIKN